MNPSASALELAALQSALFVILAVLVVTARRLVSTPGYGWRFLAFAVAFALLSRLVWP